MAAIDATAFPVKNQAYRFYFTFRGNPSTVFPQPDNQVLTSAAVGTTVAVYVDGVLTAGATLSVYDVSKPGLYFCDLTAAQMNSYCTTVFINCNNTGFQDVYVERQLYPIDLSEISNHWLDQSPKRLEQGLLQTAALCLNRVVATGAAMTVYGVNSSIPLLTGTYTENDTSSDRSKLD
jgi:hypothetical protein